jgi:hypothetical protein
LAAQTTAVRQIAFSNSFIIILLVVSAFYLSVMPLGPCVSP